MADHDLLRPFNVEMVKPNYTVPYKCARFFSDTGWGNGAWDGGRPHELYVTAIEPNCTATVLYGYGGWQHDGTGGWLSLSASIEDSKLMVAIPEHEATATYELAEDDDVLYGVWEKLDESKRSFVSLTRLEKW